MPRQLAIAFLALLIFLPGLRAQKTSPKECGELLAKVKAGNTDIDFGRLRLSWVQSPEKKHAKYTGDLEKKMFQDLNAEKYKQARDDAQQVLDCEYVSIDAHYIAYAANKELGNDAQSQFHLAVFRKLIDSIRASGDGKTEDTAFIVIAVDEEYVLLRVLGYQPGQQSLRNGKAHTFDVLTVKDKDGNAQTFYFNIDIPWAEESKMFK